ncbi:hypothetical protein [Pararcticibacter amylolyticus]|uniref:Uncharacterized protein n=1 Tax=Pararcticibacter amylolyticus TaxID=2173175 RepID=A0A2U2PHW6_9SPHI|nr:hypothetical protein [Pararcticibacter amylolyticus]PWG81008.1 hypothetical protein DDR33_08740 [Pararcticibacter amylolyticus]
MKKVGLVLGIIAGIIVCIISCNKLQSDHPQAKLAPEANTLSEEDIKMYEDSVNLILPELQKQESLVYEQGDNSFYVIKYSHNGEPVLYVENEDNGEYGKSEKRYYLKERRLLLYTENTQSYNTSERLMQNRLYFRGNTLFSSLQKTGPDAKSLHSETLKAFTPKEREQYLEIPEMEDALNQRGKFNLVFDGITQYPKARFLILSRGEFNSYRAVLRIEKEDELINELSSDPSRYTGTKFDLNWQINSEGEAVYTSGRIKR